MSALFDFSSLLTVLLLLICTCTYLREFRPTIFDPSLQPLANGQPPGPIPHNKRDGISGFFWKLSRIGERLSPYVGASCLLMGLHVLFFK